MSEISTKEKILINAHKLFADKGFNGVSIRELARECEVNIAAINYHFTNKENLYIETIRESLNCTNKDIQTIYESLDNHDVEELALKVFKHFQENAEDLRTGFKLVITSDKFYESLAEDMSRYKGPPGGEYFFTCLREEFPDVDEDDLFWAVKTIFTQLVHKALIFCNPWIKESITNMGSANVSFEEDLKRLVRVVRAELKSL
jgi:AcrR family transcriptional regulator